MEIKDELVLNGNTWSASNNIISRCVTVAGFKFNNGIVFNLVR